MNAWKRAKTSKFWPTIEKWGKRTMFILAFFGTIGGAYKGVQSVKNKLVQPFTDIEELRQLHQVDIAIIMDLMTRVEWEGEYWTVLSDGVKREVFLFMTDSGEIYAFLADDRFGFIPFRS